MTRHTSLLLTKVLTTTEPLYLYMILSLFLFSLIAELVPLMLSLCSSIFIFLFENQQPLFPACLTLSLEWTS